MTEPIIWTDATTLCVEGQGWTDTKSPFDRLPARAEGVVRDVVWDLSRHSSGVTVRFETDATALHVRWTLGNDPLSMAQTTLIACSGLDLYALAPDGRWRWVYNTREIPARESEFCLTPGPLDGLRRQYKLYLPIFSPVLKLAVGVPAGATIETVLPRPEKPLVYYGTSIIHGVGASRPGMTIPAILGRRLDYPIISLGLSGNALMEPEIAELLAELDPVLYILDALPNMVASLIEERAEAFLRRLAQARPGTPLVLVEDRTYPYTWVGPQRDENTSRRAAFKQVYGKLLAAGLGPLHYLEGDGLLGTDGDGTTDGSHASDLGASRMVDALLPVLQRLLFDL
jgi:hypothetical protein